MSDVEHSNATTSNVSPRRLVVFASGKGSNFEALLKRRQRGELSAEISVLVTNVPGCGAQELAQAHGIAVIAVPHSGFSREQHEALVFDSLLKNHKIDLAHDLQTWVVLAGYMRLFSPSWIQKLYHSQLQAARMVNIHPSLLPSFPGVHSYRQALQYGVAVTGVTVHLVTEGLDEGPILSQKPLEVLPHDTEESLSGRGLQLEHQLYGDVLQNLATKPWVVRTPAGLLGARPRVVFGKDAL